MERRLGSSSLLMMLLFHQWGDKVIQTTVSTLAIAVVSFALPMLLMLRKERSLTGIERADVCF
jgi:hypothetical protein